MSTEFKIKNAKPKDKEYTISFSDGLFIVIKPTGNKLWRFRYSFAGKRYLLSLGKYPTTTIKLAKTKQREYLDMLDKGINPSANKHLEKIKRNTAKTFGEVAEDWFENRYKVASKNGKKSVYLRMHKHLIPQIGKLPIKQIEAPMLFNIIEKIQESGLIETGNRLNSTASMIFCYGVAKGYCTRDITADYKGMLKTAPAKHMPSLTENNDIAELLKSIDTYDKDFGTKKVKYGLQIIAYIFVRASELVNSKWEYIDFDKNQWIIPAEFMKMRRDHLIPISSQVKNLLLKLQPITSHSEYIFPNDKDDTRAMCPESLNKAIRKLDSGKYIGKMVTHGFRSMASTILNEHKFRSDVIEKQLAHGERNKIRGVYNRAEYLPERVELMQWYADYLDGLKKSN
jgi:integrase